MRSLVLVIPPWPVRRPPWASLTIEGTREAGRITTALAGMLLRRIRRQRISFSRKQEGATFLMVRAITVSGVRVPDRRNSRRATQKGSAFCWSNKSLSKMLISANTLRLRKSAGISAPFLYLISKSYSVMASIRRFRVLVCTLPSFSKGRWSVYRVK
jgi:hypothetical protein